MSPTGHRGGNPMSMGLGLIGVTMKSVAVPLHDIDREGHAHTKYREKFADEYTYSIGMRTV